ncbi:hypothetical protein FALCPG4_009953 [Fusarium falciforme]
MPGSEASGGARFATTQATPPRLTSVTSYRAQVVQAPVVPVVSRHARSLPVSVPVLRRPVLPILRIYEISTRQLVAVACGDLPFTASCTPRPPLQAPKSHLSMPTADDNSLDP